MSDRDITLEDTFTYDFTTRAFTTGIPTTLAGTPVLSVKEGGNDTFITAGVTVDVDTGATPVVGLHEASVVATAANGYEAGKSYALFISAGTVGGVSVVGEVIMNFTIEASAAAVDLANGTDGLGAIKAGVDDVPTTDEFNARTLVAASYFDPATNPVANVTLVATTTTVTGGALDATVAKDATVSKEATLTARTLLAAAYFDPAADAVANVTLVATTTTLTGHTAQTADHTAGIANIPTVAEFNARTLVAAGYFDPVTDPVANVTLVATTTVNTDMRGTDDGAKAALFTGITLLAEWLGLMAGKQVADSTALVEIQATGAGSGTYSEATDSQVVLGANGVAILARLPVRLTRNVAHANFHIFMVQTDGTTPLTGATVTGGFTLDSTAEAAFGQAITELANGMYRIDITAAQTNGLNVTYRFSATGGRDRVITFVTQP